MENEAVETEVIEAEEVEQQEATEVEQGEAAQVETEQAEAAESGASDEVVVTIGDAEPAAEEESAEGLPEWVKTLRHEHREKARELRKLKAELAKQQQAQPAPAVAVGPKPTLEAADYDPEKFEADLTAWHERKRQADESERKQRDAAEATRRAWDATQETYRTQKAALKVKDFEDAEAQARDLFDSTQQGILIHAAQNKAAVVYALGTNEAAAKKLAAITDPVKFAYALGQLEKDMQVKPRKTAPLPESRVSGAGRVAGSGAADAKLSQLHEKAQKTGDFSAYYAAKREQAARKAA